MAKEQPRLLYPGGSSWNAGKNGSDGPGPSGLVVCSGNESVMFDCGIEFADRGVRHRGPDLDSIQQKLSAVVFTHSHYDHMAAASVLAARELLNGSCKIYGTPQTLRMLPLGMDEMARHGFGEWFSISDILERRHVIKEPGVIELTPDISMYVGPAGHIPGALYAAVKFKKSGHVGLVSGDMGFHEQLVVGGSRFPDDLPDEYLPNAIWWMDLTNPQLGKPQWAEESARTARFVKQELDRGQIVNLQAFGQARAQNVMLALIQAGVKPVYTGGMIPDYLRIIMEERWSDIDREIDFKKGDIKVIKNQSRFEELIGRGGPLCLVTTSGMGDFGYSNGCLHAGVSNPKWTFCGTSYVKPRSPLGRLFSSVGNENAEIALEDDVGKKYTYPIRAAAEHFRGWSAHATLGDWVDVCRKLVKRRRKVFGKNKQLLDTIVLTHGTQQAKGTAETVLRQFAKEVRYGNMNTEIEILSHS